MSVVHASKLDHLLNGMWLLWMCLHGDQELQSVLGRASSSHAFKPPLNYNQKWRHFWSVEDQREHQTACLSASLVSAAFSFCSASEPPRSWDGISNGHINIWISSKMEPAFDSNNLWQPACLSSPHSCSSKRIRLWHSIPCCYCQSPSWGRWRSRMCQCKALLPEPLLIFPSPNNQP